MAKDFVRLDDKNFEKYFKQLFAALTYHSYKVLKDYDLAKDIVHEAFAKLWENRYNISTQGNVKAYLYRTVYNLSINYIRDNKKLQSTENTADSQLGHENFEYKLEFLEMEQAVINAINSMPAKMKKVFVLSRYDGLKYREIAEKLSISIKTVEVHISNALKFLRKRLKNYLDK